MSHNWSSLKTKGIKASRIREVLSKVEEAHGAGIEITNFSIGRPDFDTPLHIKEATKTALDKGLVHYTASAGLAELRETICRYYHEDHQLDVEPGEVLITTGATEAIYVGLQSILNPGDEVLVPQPMYAYYEGWSFLGGANCVTVPLKEEDRFFLKAEAVKKYITRKTKVLIINSPHNPTGQVFEKMELTKIAELAVKYDFIVVSDDIYQDMLYDNTEHFHIAKASGMKERTLIIGSFSKTYAMDGWRIGYMIGPSHIITEALKIHQHVVGSPNSFVQIGAQAALTAPQYCVKDMVNELDQRRRLLISYLDDLGLPYVRPRGAFYIFPSIKKYGLNSKRFSEFLFDEARVAVVAGDAFGPAGEGYIRIAYTTAYEEIEKAMGRIRTALKRM